MAATTLFSLMTLIPSGSEKMLEQMPAKSANARFARDVLFARGQSDHEIVGMMGSPQMQGPQEHRTDLALISLPRTGVSDTRGV